MLIDAQTPEQIARYYSACIDSVWMINDAISKPDQYANDPTVIKRNVKYLVLMSSASFWTTEDMGSINTAIAAGNLAMNG